MKGIPTVLITVSPEVSAQMRPPRALYPKGFKIGNSLGRPGMRELQLFDMAGAVDETFPDIDALGQNCRFRDCRHHQEPGCAVKRAVDEGTLDAARYGNFLKLQEEQEAFAKRQDERALLDSKRQSKIGSRAMKSLQKDRE